MWRILAYLAVMCLAAFGAVELSNLSGEVNIRLPNYDARIDLSVAVTFLVVIALVIALVWWLIGAIIRLPRTLRQARKTRRQAKGYQALSRGMIAVGAGDSNQAIRHAREAERLLGQDPLALLLNAQVAQTTGDLSKADAAFQKMVANPETRLLGLRGLFMEARRQGHSGAAYDHARAAIALSPSTGWANEAVLEGLCVAGAWSDALDMIEKRLAFGLIDKATAKRHRAVLLTANALSIRYQAPDNALADAIQALKFAPQLIPAAALAGRLLGQRNDVRKASKILEKAWQATPHPDLADAYIYLRAGDSALDRLKRAETLGKLANWAREARLAVAQAALEAREFRRARDVLQPLLDDGPTMRTCLAMADIEEAEFGAGGHVRQWISRAARALPDPAWIADGVISEHWAPFSPVSGHIDAFVWQTPPVALSAPQDRRFDIDAEPVTTAPQEPVIIAPLVISDSAGEAEPKKHGSDSAPAKAEAMPAAPDKPLDAEPASDAPSDAPVAAPAEPEKPIEPEQPAPASSKPETEASPAVMVENPPPEKDKPVATPAEKEAMRPKPVVFPILHAPDDPGIEEDAEKDANYKQRR